LKPTTAYPIEGELSKSKHMSKARKYSEMIASDTYPVDASLEQSSRRLMQPGEQHNAGSTFDLHKLKDSM